MGPSRRLRRRRRDIIGTAPFRSQSPIHQTKLFKGRDLDSAPASPHFSLGSSDVRRIVPSAVPAGIVKPTVSGPSNWSIELKMVFVTADTVRVIRFTRVNVLLVI